MYYSGSSGSSLLVLDTPYSVCVVNIKMVIIPWIWIDHRLGLHNFFIIIDKCHNYTSAKPRLLRMRSSSVKQVTGTTVCETTPTIATPNSSLALADSKKRKK